MIMFDYGEGVNSYDDTRKSKNYQVFLYVFMHFGLITVQGYHVNV